jgi:hypothetical protein
VFLGLDRVADDGVQVEHDAVARGVKREARRWIGDDARFHLQQKFAGLHVLAGVDAEPCDAARDA